LSRGPFSLLLSTPVHLYTHAFWRRLIFFFRFSAGEIII
jgi:hypothetical protein